MRAAWQWLEAVLLASALAGCAVMPSGADAAAPSTHALSYLALGDSYTIGEGVAASERWPDLLATRLRAEGIALADPQVIATTGWTTDELDAAIDAARPAHDFDFVSLLIGVNDQYRGRPLADYQVRFAALLERAIAMAHGRSGRVLVLSIPDWGVTRFGAGSGRDTDAIARELDAYNTAAHALCSARGVAFIDITAISRARGSEAAMLASDGLHPAPAMHALWARAALPVARRLLAQ